jgi:hypothetical protein
VLNRECSKIFKVDVDWNLDDGLGLGLGEGGQGWVCSGDVKETDAWIQRWNLI